MTSKEALENMCRRCEKNINSIPSNGNTPFKECPFRSMTNDYCLEYDTIKKDLEVLEVLKRHLKIRIQTDEKHSNFEEIVAYTKNENKQFGEYDPYLFCNFYGESKILCGQMGSYPTQKAIDDYYKVKEWLEDGKTT